MGKQKLKKLEAEVKKVFDIEENSNEFILKFIYKNTKYFNGKDLSDEIIVNLASNAYIIRPAYLMQIAVVKREDLENILKYCNQYFKVHKNEYYRIYKYR